MTNPSQLLKEAEDDMQKKVRATRPKEGEVSILVVMGGGGGVLWGSQKKILVAVVSNFGSKAEVLIFGS